MEAVFMTRGHIDDTEKFIRNLRSQWMKFSYKGGALIEMNVKPILLWNIAFPKEYKDIVLNTIDPTPEESEKSHKKKYSGILKFFWAIRKAIGLKPFPKERSTEQRFPVWKENIEVLPIGIKEDEMNLPDDDGTKKECI